MNLAQNLDLTIGANLLRVACGLFLVPHLVIKFRNQDFVKGFMARAGLNPPAAWLYGAFAIEIFASICLLLGVLTVWAASLAAAFLVVAAWASWKISEGKWIWNFGGAEYPLFWAVCCVVVAMQAAV